LLPDFANQLAIFKNAGVYFGEYDNMLLQKSIKELATKTPAMTFGRLWGKIHGTQKDYYILEGFAPLEEGAPVDEEAEARGAGVNEFVYWATNSACGPWT
jgi:hypothetical protein